MGKGQMNANSAVPNTLKSRPWSSVKANFNGGVDWRPDHHMLSTFRGVGRPSIFGPSDACAKTKTQGVGHPQF